MKKKLKQADVVNFWRAYSIVMQDKVQLMDSEEFTQFVKDAIKLHNLIVKFGDTELPSIDVDLEESFSPELKTAVDFADWTEEEMLHLMKLWNTENPYACVEEKKAKLLSAVTKQQEQAKERK